MDKKIYEKTRYQNIYRHKKNKNYVIMMSKPVKTSISRIDGKKITDIDSALKIRDNYAIRIQKGQESVHKESFDVLWEKYMYYCKYIKKLSYNTLIRKEKCYNRYLKNAIKKSTTKIDKNYISNFIDECKCSNKQKNEMIKILKAFFNWCVEEDYIIKNPINKIEKYKVEKAEMKYWLPNESQAFLTIIDNDIKSNDVYLKKRAMIVKTLTIIGLAIGDRTGETRALKFGDFDFDNCTVNVHHSINYDRSNECFVKETKTKKSKRIVNIDQKLLEQIKTYKLYLENECNYEITNDTLLFLNHETKRPYSDVTLRKKFYYYCEKANVTKIRMYDLRHTFVATMMAENVDISVVSQFIGHENVGTTVNEYGHITSDVKKKIADIASKYY